MPFLFQPSSVDSEMDGVTGSISGLHVSLAGLQRVDELNDRISNRMISDHKLPVLFDPRSVPTKYSQFPIIERRARPTEKREIMPEYSVSEKTFAPLHRRGPVNYFLANIDTETVLQNRHVAYQKFADQGVYVPHSSSDLYKVEAVGRQEEQTHPSLFRRETYATSGSKVANLVGHEFFRNSTRTQLRGL